MRFLRSLVTVLVASSIVALSPGFGCYEAFAAALHDSGARVDTRAVAAAGAARAIDTLSITELQDLASNAKSSDDDRTAAIEQLGLIDSPEALTALQQVADTAVKGDLRDYEFHGKALVEANKKFKTQGKPILSKGRMSVLAAQQFAKIYLIDNKPELSNFDYDDTLEPFNKPATEATGAGLKSVADAGIATVVNTDRTSILESLATITAEQRDSFFVAANRGARVLLPSGKGEYRTEREEPGWSSKERDALGGKQAVDFEKQTDRKEIGGVAAVVRAKFGLGEFAGKSWDISPYGFALFLPVGSSAEQIQGAADLLQSELKKKGIDAQVIGRPAKKDTDPPYLSVSKIDKSLGVALLKNNLQRYLRYRDVYHHVPTLLQGVAKRALDFLAFLRLLPRKPVAAKSILNVGDQYIGQRNVDADMQKGAPGSISISVGGTADPALPNTYVWNVDGPEGTRQIMAHLATQSADGWQKVPVIGSFLQRTFSIACFVGTSVAYPLLAIPIVGFDGYGALMGLGGLVAIATGPISGMIADRLSMQKAMALNTLIRAFFALDMPLWSLLGILVPGNPYAIVALIWGSIANGWLLSSIMVTEQTYNKQLAGAKNLTTINALYPFHGLLIQTLLTTPILAGVFGVSLGGFIDAHNLLLPFLISAGVHMFIVLPLVWFLMPKISPTPSTIGRMEKMIAANDKRLAAGSATLFERLLLKIVPHNKWLLARVAKNAAKLKAENENFAKMIPAREKALAEMIPENDQKIEQAAKDIESLRANVAAVRIYVARRLDVFPLRSLFSRRFFSAIKEWLTTSAAIRRDEFQIAALGRNGSQMKDELARRRTSFKETMTSRAKAVWRFLSFYRVPAVIFAASVGVALWLHSPLPVAASLVLWISRTPGFKALWAQKNLRWAMLLAGLGAFLTYPVQSLALPLMALTLAGVKGKAVLVSLMMGSFFIGQLISYAGTTKLSKLRWTFVGRFGAERLIWILTAGITAAWVFTGLVHGSWLAAAGGAAAAFVLMKLKSRLTELGSIKFMGIGLAFIVLPWYFWPSIAAILISVFGIGIFLGSAVAAIGAYFQKHAITQNMGAYIGIQGSFFNASISAGYGEMGLMTRLFHPAFPGSLLPLIGLFGLAGIVYYFAPRFMPGLPKTALKPREQ